ncbi:hypothetical protein BDQ17DRAFT_1354419 [Cyathus striatus]|nr:hypothetical protein BDQ17DRAFT_1354419 [Cyathus striatus]
MKLKQIHRTSTFAWSPTPELPLIATGTVAGALDESFSNESQLEIWAPDWLDSSEFDLGLEGYGGPKGAVKDTARFNRLAWGYVDPSRPRGVIAAGMEDGALSLWDPVEILAGAGADGSLIQRTSAHSGPVRALDFNPIQTNLLASGGVNGEVFIWDLKAPAKPYSPTNARSTKLDELTSTAWNQQVQHVLAGSSSTGYTVVWDLRGRREVCALAYGGGPGTGQGMGVMGGGMGVSGGRRGMSDVAWHPDNATRIITASEDDSSPIIMVWDLRNARAPEKILTGHEKGVLSLSWCKQDADLLLSCGKDNRALCWNPQTGEAIGELPSADNWAFQVEWCPRNPDLLATAFFDGTSTDSAPAPVATPSTDIFAAPIQTQSTSTFALKQPPKWLKRPVNASFAFGGSLVSVSNLPSAQGQNQSCAVHIRKVVTESSIVERAKKLKEAIEKDGNALESFAEEKVKVLPEGQGEYWKALVGLFRADSRDELVALLGFSKEEVKQKVAEAVEKLKNRAPESEATVEETDIARERETVVSFAEPEREDSPEAEAVAATPTTDEAPSDSASASATSTASETSTTRLGETESESATTVHTLFSDGDDGDDPFNVVPVQDDGAQHGIHIPHTNYPLDSSVAATIGSGPSSLNGDDGQSVSGTNGFRIYPNDESETEKLVTKALVLGDFASAVSLCLSADRFADAILLAVRGGPELLQATQKAYFERQTTHNPYLRLFQSIVTNDLEDIVQNAELSEWREIFVVVCTFAGKEEFAGLVEALGRRLEFQSELLEKDSELDEESEKEKEEYRRNATFMYLASGKLERLVSIWNEELVEEEMRLTATSEKEEGSYGLYAAHVHALQTFVEKVTVFRGAIKYIDGDITIGTERADETVKTFKLSALYDRYLEYAAMLADQGLVKEAVTFLNWTPSVYKQAERERLLTGAGAQATLVPVAAAAPPAPIPQVTTVPPATSTYGSYNPPQPAPGPYAPSASTQPQTSYASFTHSPYGPQSTPQSHQAPLPPPPVRAAVPPPPRNMTGTPNGGVAQLKKDAGHWNDPPVVKPPSRAGSSLNIGKPAAITAPFPNAAPSPGYSPTGSPYQAQSAPGAAPPPPRPGSRAQQPIPPPPQGHRMQGPPQPGGPGYASHMRPASSTGAAVPPPARMMSPPHGQLPPRQPTPSQYAPPLHSAVPGQTPPPGQGPYAPPQAGHMQPPLAGPYGRSTAPPGPSQYGPGPSPQQQQPPPHPGITSSFCHGGAPPPPPPPPGGPAGPPRAAPSAPPARAAPPPPKYPVGDRSHIPDSAMPAFNVIAAHLNRMKQSTPPQQRRLVEDLERRINPLFEALNCDTLSKTVVDQLLVLTRAMEAGDRPAALAIHVELLTRGSQTDDIGMWMSGLKQLIMRM